MAPRTWEEAAEYALHEIVTSGNVIVPRKNRAEWVDMLIDSLPLPKDSDDDMRELFCFIGYEAYLDSGANPGELLRLLASKQRDYGHGNILKFGRLGIVVRLSDKLERLKNLTAKGVSPANESIADTLHDIVGYSVIALMLLDGTFKLELACK